MDKHQRYSEADLKRVVFAKNKLWLIAPNGNCLTLEWDTIQRAITDCDRREE